MYMFSAHLIFLSAKIRVQVNARMNSILTNRLYFYFIKDIIVKKLHLRKERGHLSDSMGGIRNFSYDNIDQPNFN